MAIIATGSKTIIDLSDGKLLTVYLSSNHPKSQMYDPNPNANPVFTPNWNSTSGTKVTITPNVAVNYNNILLDDANLLEVNWSVKDGGSAESTLGRNAYANAELQVPAATPASVQYIYHNQLEVRDNALFTSTSKMLTYIASIKYHDPDTQSDIIATAEITFAMMSLGTNAKSVFLTGPQVIKYMGGSSTPTPATLVIDAIIKNTTISKWEYYKTTATVGWTTFNGTNASATIAPDTAGYWDAASSLCQIRCYADNNNIFDSITLTKISDGVNPVTGNLTNESVTLAADVNGTVASFAIATGTFKMFKGVTDVTTSSAFAVYGSAVNCTGSIAAGTGIYSVTAMSADTASIAFSGTYQGTVIYKTFTLSKSRAGLAGGAGSDGAAAKTLEISAEGNVFYRGLNGTISSPNAIKFTANKQNISGSVAWSGAVFHNAATGGSAVTTGDAVYLQKASMGVNTSLTITAVGDSITDKVTIITLRDGMAAVQASLDNDAHTFPADSNGVISVASYAESITQISVFEGTQLLTFVTGASTTAGQWRFTGIVYTGIALNGSITAVANKASLAFNNMNLDSATVVYTIEGKRMDGTVFTSFTKTQNFSKSKQGIGYVAEIISTTGDIFKNALGNTLLYCRIWENGVEIDAMKLDGTAIDFSQSGDAPAFGTAGHYYYQYNPTTAQILLMRDSGSAWVDVTANATYMHTQTYTWIKISELGVETAFATGKAIYVDQDDVTNKTTFRCEVS